MNNENLLKEFVRDLDILWSLIGAYLVFFRQAGFSMLEAGTVRKQNVINILFKNLIYTSLAAIVWWAIGYPLAFEAGHNENGFVGGSHFFMADKNLEKDETFYARWMFQYAFAATTTAIMSGAAVDRCRYQVYLIYTVFATGFIYPVVVHWAWSKNGWLSTANPDRTFEGSLGFMDYAGSSVVHVTGGAAAFFVAWFLEPRSHFMENGKVKEIMPSNQSLTMLGTFILWFGWYAFNSASGLCVSNDCMMTASLVAVNTTLSAASGSMAAFSIHILLYGNGVQIKPGLNGLLAGLVGITAGCAVVEPFAAVIIGSLSGAVYYICSRLLLLLKIDDPSEASCIHFSSGLIGTIAVGFFATKTNIRRAYATRIKENEDFDCGLFYGGDGTQLAVQVLGTIAIACWTCVISSTLFWILKKWNRLRIPEPEKLSRFMDERIEI